MRRIEELRIGLRLVALSLVGFCGNGDAQTYPIKPVRLIVPYTAGGGADSTTRLVAVRVTEQLGQQIVIENRGGGGGNIGAGIAAKSPPDGYTLLLASAALSASVSIFDKLPFVLSDFTAVSLLSKTPSLLAVHPSLPVKSVQELIKLARARPGQINYAGGDVASLLHLDVEYFKSMAKINLVRVPYNGSGPSLIAALAGEASVIMAPALLVVPHTRTGKLRALALTSAQRAPALPDLPTVTESGLPGFEAQQWYGVLAPAGVPDAILNRLNVEFGKAVNGPELSARLIGDVSIPVGSSRREFEHFFQQDIEKWKKVLRLSRDAELRATQ
jgi:tripartite-type tricarboxylate transporter receptor subunit TctC